MNDDAGKPWRIFCAVEVPPAASRLITDHIEKLRAVFPEVKASWSRDGKFHITLKFFGVVSQKRVSSIAQATARATAAFGKFDLVLGGTGAFPNNREPRV